MGEDVIGTVIHYFGKPGVGVVKLTAELKVGDQLRFHGATTDFQQEISSMEVEHGPVEVAGAGDEVAIKVDERVRKRDRVLKVTQD